MRQSSKTTAWSGGIVALALCASCGEASRHPLLPDDVTDADVGDAQTDAEADAQTDAEADAETDAEAPDGHASDRFNEGTRCKVGARPGPTPVLQPSVLQTGLAGDLAGVAVDVGFVDEDSLPDVLIAASLSNGGDVLNPTFVTILRGTGSGFTRGDGESVEIDLGKRPFLADVNGDRRHDVVNDRWVSFARGTGRLAEPTLATTENAQVAWGNVDGDDFVDLVLVTQTEFRIYAGGPSGLTRLTTDVRHDIVDITTRHLFMVRDVDGNGLGDLVAVTQAFDVDGTNPPSKIDTVLSEAGAPFSRREATLELEPGVFLARLEFGDFDCDGGLDLVATNPDDGRVELRLRVADGWGAPQGFDVGPSDVYVVGAIATDVGDLNADGAHDLVVATTAFSQSGERSVQVDAFLGDGSGSLGSPIVLTPPDTDYFVPHAIAVRDLDGDGRDDIIATMLEHDDTMAVWMSVAP
jgi:hypothetical protein